MAGSAVAVPVATDAGWRWMVVLGSFMAYYIADGWSYSFGVFYPELLGYFKEGKGKTALIAAFLYGTPMLISPIVCALTTAYGCRYITCVGGLVTGLSLAAGYFAASVNMLCVTTGILSSIGLSMTYIPSLFIVTFYFERWRGLATGLAVTGSGLGAFAFPPLMEYLVGEYTWRGMLLIFGGICFNITVAGCLYRPPPMGYPNIEEDGLPQVRETLDDSHVKCTSSNVRMPQLHDSAMNSDSSISLDKINEQLNEQHCDKQVATAPTDVQLASSPDLYVHITAAESGQQRGQRKEKHCEKFLTELYTVAVGMLDISFLKNGVYILYVISGFIMFLWVGVPYVYLVDYALEQGISPQTAPLLLSCIAIGRIIGQILLGLLGDMQRVNAVVLYAVCIMGCGVGTALVPLCVNYASLAIYASVFGLCVSVTYVLPMINLVIIVGLEKSSSAFGIQQLIQGIATLLGMPVAGLWTPKIIHSS